MTQLEFLKGSAVVVITIAAASLSMPYVDRYVEASSAAIVSHPNTRPAPTDTPQATPSATASEGPSPCVQGDGSWKNWPWPNLPTLSPRCAPDK
jgi:hypothetical protein